MDKINKKIAKIGESLENELVEFLRSIIKIPSMSGKEKEVIARIKEEMEKIGYDEILIDPFGNLIGRIGTGKRIIAIDGHCDTVDTGNLNTWSKDPFEGEYSNNTIYGRGAADQKGGLASAVYSGKIIKKIGIPEDISFYVVASVLEEDFEGLCWYYIIKENRIKPEIVILTEPTDMEIKIGQRGRLEIEIQTLGISSHGSAPSKGENAISKMAPIIQEIDLLNSKMSIMPLLGKGTVAVTGIQSFSPSLCAVPDRSKIHLDRRLTVGETMETAIKEVSRLRSVKLSGAKLTVPEYDIKSYTGLTHRVKAYYPFWLMEMEHPLVQYAARVYTSQFKEEAKIGIWGFSTNGVATKGLFNIPTIGFGPGKEEHAHTPRDQVSVDELVKAMNFYSSFVINIGNNI